MNVIISISSNVCDENLSLAFKLVIMSEIFYTVTVQVVQHSYILNGQ